MMHRKIILCLLSLIPATVVFCQNKYDQTDSLFTNLSSQNKFNGNVLIAEKGKIIFRKSFGLANESTKEPLNDSSIFELASVSKQFTAMGIVLLKEKGKLNYDDLLAKYIPELAFYKNVTIRNLLNHTSGLPDYMEIMDSVWDKSEIANNNDMIRILAKHQPKKYFESNSKYEYCNTGYALLASVIEKVSGLSYREYMAHEIFGPLEMRNTFVYNRRYKPELIKNYAFGYVYSETSNRKILPDSLPDYKLVIWLDGIVGDGAVNSTCEDLLKWDRALYTSKVASKKSIDEIYSPAVLNDKKVNDYGFGWALEYDKDFGKIVNHGGGWPGYMTYIERHTLNDKTIILLQNNDGGSLPVKTIRLILYGKPLPLPVVHKEIKVDDAVLQSYVGEYEFEPGFVLSVTKNGNQLLSQLTGQESFEIYPESRNKFFLKVVDAQLEFVSDKNKQVAKVILYQNGNEAQALKKK
jgi:CubicO group peptidase (beta-lactamase class C family)